MIKLMVLDDNNQHCDAILSEDGVIVIDKSGKMRCVEYFVFLDDFKVVYSRPDAIKIGVLK